MPRDVSPFPHFHRMRRRKKGRDNHISTDASSIPHLNHWRRQQQQPEQPEQERK